MNNKIIIAIVVIAIVIFGAYFVLLKNTGTETPVPGSVSQAPSQETPTAPNIPSSPPATQETPQAEQNAVIYTDTGYSPANLSVKVGATVTFKNESSLAMWPASAMHPSHAVYSGITLGEHCPDVAKTAFDACAGIQPGGSWNFTFNKKGDWKYHDHLAPKNFGTIKVE